MLESEPHDNDLRDQIREAFRVFDDQDLGYIPADDLKDILTTIGDKLTEGDYFNMYMYESCIIRISNHIQNYYLKDNVTNL